MILWHHRLDGREFEQAPGVGDGQGILVCCNPWGHKEGDMTEWLNGKHTWVSLVAQTVKNLPAVWETRIQSFSREIHTTICVHKIFFSVEVT